MSFFGKAKCFIGIHDWTPWDYKADGHCEQKRSCRRCAKSEEQVAHVFTEFAYVQPGKCDQSRKCRRCAHTETRKSHAGWSEWKYPKPDDCHQDHACTRCGEHESRVAHVWGTWQFEGPKSCNQVRFCTRCKEGREFQAAEDHHHTWHAEQRVSCSEMRQTCERCGAVKSRDGEFHRFGGWEPAPGGAQRRCQDCGKLETGPAAHMGQQSPASGNSGLGKGPPR